MAKVETIQQAIRFLAGVCDGAATVDGHGFNRNDTEFGHSLAQQERWTEKQTIAAQKLANRYKRQLSKAGFDLAEIEGEVAPVKTQSTPTVTRTTAKPGKKATVLDNRIKIEFPFNPETLDIVKSIPGRRFNGDAYPKHWTAPISIDAVKILSKNGFTLDPQLEVLLEQNQITVEEVKEIKIPGLKLDLFPYQKKGVAFIEAKGGRALLADEMGLGKTIQGLAWLQLHPEKRPAIILCPSHLKLNWAKEAKAVLSGKPEIQILQGTKPYEITGEIIIINYDILSKWVDTLKTIQAQVLIFDEAHYIKSNSAQRTKATKSLAKGIPHVIALTGTPIVNRPIEGFNIAQVINNKLFPNFMDYARKYCGAHHNGFGWDFTGATNKEELHKKLVESIMIRRKKADVLPDLPSKLYSYTPIKLDNEKEYRKVEADFIRFVKETKGKEAAIKASRAEHLAKIEALKQLSIQGKMKQATQWIRDFLDANGNKLVVFAVHKTTVDHLMEEFKGEAVKIDGSVSATKRNEAVEEFQNNPKVKLFVGNIQAAGTGLTLTAASSVAFLELPWTPGELVQAEDRCHRIGQKNTVNVYYLLAADSIEEKIAEILDEKRSVLDAIIDGKDQQDIGTLTKLMESYEKGGK